MEAEWKLKGIYTADPSKVAAEIEELGDRFTLKDVVDRARDEGSEMHSCFEWNDKIAGEKYRESQAGNVVRMLVIRKEETIEEPEKTVRLFYSTGERENVYTPVRRIAYHENEYKALLKRALAELKAFRKKYETLSELKVILDEIDAVVNAA